MNIQSESGDKKEAEIEIVVEIAEIQKAEIKRQRIL
jgi:hypothetical protein